MARTETRGTESGSDRGADVATPDAEQLERIVDVAEWLGISPTVASAALRSRGGEVRTDVRLEASIRQVERRLRRET